jgi:hypothetical protein
MTEIEQLLREELDQAYPAPVGEPDWDEVLRRLAPARGTQPQRKR